MAHPYDTIRNITNSGMQETIRRLYNEGKLSGRGLENAIKKGYITRDQMMEISKPYNTGNE